MSGHNGSLGHDYINILGDYRIARALRNQSYNALGL